MMGGEGSGRGCQKKRLPRELERKGIHAAGMGEPLYAVAYLMGFHKKISPRFPPNKRRDKALDKLNRYRNYFPDFDAELEAAAHGLRYNSKAHALRSAFPVDHDGKWLKGDSAIAIHLLKTMFGLRDSVTSQDVAQALAPLIQFNTKEPLNGQVQGEAKSYFDPPKEAEVG